jgi:glucosamine--fructose-6-phosphate aminotransferase (isomerizing)
MALAGVTDRIVYLEEGDVVDLQMGKHWIVHRQADGTLRPLAASDRAGAHRAGTQWRGRAGPVPHYMQKEIFEQPRAIADTLDAVQGISPELFGDGAYAAFKAVTAC